LGMFIVYPVFISPRNHEEHEEERQKYLRALRVFVVRNS